MKQQLKRGIAACAFCLLTFSAFAQDETFVTPRWASEKGYWVVEGNVHEPLHNVVRFYSNGHVLVYTETLDNVKLELDRRKVKMKLKKVLEASILAWTRHKQPEANKGYVKVLLK